MDTRRTGEMHRHIIVHSKSSILFSLKTKLEQLLEIYPPEEIESRRWEKIATALGNRTVRQVINLPVPCINHLVPSTLKSSIAPHVFVYKSVC